MARACHLVCSYSYFIIRSHPLAISAAKPELDKSFVPPSNSRLNCVTCVVHYSTGGIPCLLPVIGRAGDVLAENGQ